MPSQRLLHETKHNHNTAPTHYIDAKGVRYAYRRFGNENGVPILLLPHFRAMMDDWDPLVTDGLAKTRPVILFDNAGIGASSGVTPDTISEMAAQAFTFISALGLTHIDLFGFSLGGMVAQQLLLDHSVLFRRAILAGTGPQGGVGMQSYSPEVQDRAARTPPDKKFLFFEHNASGEKAGEAFLQRISSRTVDRVPATTSQAMQAQATAIAGWGSAPAEPYLEKLKRISIPVLVANGSDDIMVPTVNSITLAQNLPTCYLILYPNSGHGGIFQYASLFTNHATLFLVQKDQARCP